MKNDVKNINEEKYFEKIKLKHSLLFPSFFILVIWLVELTESSLNLDLRYLGIFPLKWSGLIGILTSPLIHSDFNHIFNNSTSMFILSIGLFYFYRPLSYKIFFIIYFTSGVLVWLMARPAYHIGCSGVIYGLASFLFFSGIIRNDIRLMAISLIVIFLYGSMIWGIFPLDHSISWESHLWGGFSGMFLSIIYRNHGPRRPRYSWETEEEYDEEDDVSEDTIKGREWKDENIND
ncbi:rhomboid family intramembrane serine protease [Bacteroidota bacterium]